MDIIELSNLIDAEDHVLQRDANTDSKLIIVAVGHIGPTTTDDLILNLRHHPEKSVSVAIIRDDQNLDERLKKAELVIDYLPVPDPSELEKIVRDLTRDDVPEIVAPKLFINSPISRNRNFFIPVNQKIPANCRVSNRNVLLNRRILKK